MNAHPEPALRENAWRVALWLGIALASWLGMQIVHEFGHCVGAWTTGGQVVRVELRPWTISRTDVEPNPHPLLERWAGPAIGVQLPLALLLAAVLLNRPWQYLVQFFAGFCLIANGAYLGVGALHPVGDAADILRLWPSPWPLAIFGTVAAAAGLRLWHGLGPHFGLGSPPSPVNRRHTRAVWCLVATIVVAELALASLP